MAGLASALARRGHRVVFTAERMMSDARARQGWSPPELEGVNLEQTPSRKAMARKARQAPPGSIHLCQGIRGNGAVRSAQRVLRRSGHTQWVIMEAVNDSGWIGPWKRLLYRFLFQTGKVDVVLATGWRTSKWVRARGYPGRQVFPFTYFLEVPRTQCAQTSDRDLPFRFLFVGQIIQRKRLDLLIRAAGQLDQPAHVTVVGDGPLGHRMRRLASTTLGDRCRWVGQLPSHQVADEMTRADCLVLPSDHDGWGAVVTEALMVGTPAICSDACGAAEAVEHSGYGGVFRQGDLDSLRESLVRFTARGRLSIAETLRLSRWARSFSATAGARYLEAIFDHLYGRAPRPAPPWRETAAS